MIKDFENFINEEHQHSSIDMFPKINQKGFESMLKNIILGKDDNLYIPTLFIDNGNGNLSKLEEHKKDILFIDMDNVDNDSELKQIENEIEKRKEKIIVFVGNLGFGDSRLFNSFSKLIMKTIKNKKVYIFIESEFKDVHKLEKSMIYNFAILNIEKE